MFTGIIEDVGKIVEVRKTSKSYQLKISSNKILKGTNIGDSIAVNGICLTATSINGNIFSADVMNETILKTANEKFRPGKPANLERAMSINSRFGGHIVSGHVDGVGYISNIKNDGIARIITIDTIPEITKYIVTKGSIAIDGISLTVVEVGNTYFKVSIVTHTMENTTLPLLKIKDRVNLEVDPIAKYTEKLLGGKQK